jgi:hypothetical protein
VHAETAVRAAFELAETGANATDIARQLGIPRTTVRDWLAGAVPRIRPIGGCPRCGSKHAFSELPAEYVYLLGLYLGDGCISSNPRGIYRLRIVLDVKYPGIIDSTAAAMRKIRGGTTHVQLRPKNCVEVSAYWKCWPCLFPQHGPGKKHDRPIVLDEWQRQLAARRPDQLLRGLINSDGCRFQNTGRGNWSWPRYSFTNLSADIRAIFCHACDQLGLRWTEAKTTIYVSRKADVATLDGFIGPKR